MRSSSITTLPIVRLFLYSMLMAIVTGVLGYAVCVRTGNVTAMSIVMVFSAAIGMALILRWWIPVNRAMGLPRATPTRGQWFLLVGGLTSFGAAVVIGHTAYRITQNRFAEIIAAICAIMPIGFFTVLQAHRWTPKVTSSEFPSARLNYYLQLGLPVLFACNLFMQLTERHVDRSIIGLTDWVLPMYFAYFAIWPFSITLVRRRYLQAKALKDSEPPDRWQLYNDKLARNE